MSLVVVGTTLKEMNGRKHEQGGSVLSTDERFFRGMYLEIHRVDGSLVSNNEIIGSLSSVIAPVFDRALSQLDTLVGTIPQMNDPIDAGLPHFDRFVDNLRMVGATSGVASVTIEIQRKTEDIIRPRTGVTLQELPWT